MEKPYRFIGERVASYAEEGAAFLRRRRARSQSFVRVWRSDGSITAPDRSSSAASPYFEAAEQLIELADAE